MRKIFCAVLALAVAGTSFAARAVNRETPVVLAVREASPAVVNISTEVVEKKGSPFASDPFFDKFFRDFFGDYGGRERKSSSLGSGVVVDAKGHVLTNEHVVRNASRITVTFINGRTSEAKLVGADARTDLAVLRIEGERPQNYVEMGVSDDLMIGETVIAIGNPFGLSNTVTTGVVSATNRSIRGGDGRAYSEFIQTDASINPGNSGGPLLNIEGKLIGINAAIYQSAEGIGFAIPVDKARRIMADLINFGEVHRAWIGLQVQEVDSELASYYKLKKTGGVLVKSVYKGGPAQAAGVKRGDLVLAINSTPVASRSDFFDKLAGFTAKSRIRLTVKSGEGEREIHVDAAELPKGYGMEMARGWLGVEVADNGEKAAKKYNLATTKGVVVKEVVKGGAAAGIGIEPGDVIRKINDAEVEGEKEFYERVAQASTLETVVIVVQRGRVAYHVTLSPQ